MLWLLNCELLDYSLIMKVMMVFVTFPHIEVAREIGTVIVERQLAACVNLVPKMESIYYWEGKVCREDEVLGIFKVNEKRCSQFEEAMSDLHPYDTPEILGVGVERGLEKYLDWVRRG